MYDKAVGLHVHSRCCVCTCRDGRIAELSVDSASPVTVLSSPGANHLDTDGYLWLGLFCSHSRPVHRCHQQNVIVAEISTILDRRSAPNKVRNSGTFCVKLAAN